MTAHTKNTNLVNVAFEMAFFKQLLKSLSLEQMQEMVGFLNTEIHQKIMMAAQQTPNNNFSSPLVSAEMLSNWDNNISDEEEPFMNDETFNKAVKEMS